MRDNFERNNIQMENAKKPFWPITLRISNQKIHLGRLLQLSWIRMQLYLARLWGRMLFLTPNNRRVCEKYGFILGISLIDQKTKLTKKGSGTSRNRWPSEILIIPTNEEFGNRRRVFEFAGLISWEVEQRLHMIKHALIQEFITKRSFSWCEIIVTIFFTEIFHTTIAWKIDMGISCPALPIKHFFKCLWTSFDHQQKSGGIFFSTDSLVNILSITSPRAGLRFC